VILLSALTGMNVERR